jgi:hypothetical protein
MVVAVVWRHAASLHYIGQGRFRTSVPSAKISLVAVVRAAQLTVCIEYCKSLRAFIYLRHVRHRVQKTIKTVYPIRVDCSSRKQP